METGNRRRLNPHRGGAFCVPVEGRGDKRETETDALMAEERRARLRMAFARRKGQGDFRTSGLSRRELLENESSRIVESAPWSIRKSESLGRRSNSPPDVLRASKRGNGEECGVGL